MNTMTQNEFKVSVFGLGKAGLALAAVIADSGINTTGVDVNREVVEKINSGKSTVQEEPELDGLIAKNIGKTLRATTDGVNAVKNANAHIIIVPLYIDDDKKPNYSNILAVAGTIAKGLKKGDLVVLETTAPVGTTETLLCGELERKSGLKLGEFFLAHSPERIMTGYSISRFKEFPKVVGGVDEKSGAKAEELYKGFCKKIVRVKDARTAELIKIAEGVYRDTNIAIANELYKMCDAYRINFWEVKRAAAHEYCNILEPGVGVGGHCIPIYPHFLLQDKRLEDIPLITATSRAVNDSMAEYIAKKAVAKSGKNSSVLVIGLTYREGVKELAYTRSKALVNSLKTMGAKVTAIDPLLSKSEINENFEVPAANENDDWTKFNCVIVVNKEKIYAGKLKSLKQDKVIDCKNLLERM